MSPVMNTATRCLFPTMNVGDDKGHRRGTGIFDPMGARAEFGEDLAGVQFLCRSVVMVVGQNPGEQVDDRRIALMAVETDMAARRHDRSAAPERTLPRRAPNQPNTMLWCDALLASLFSRSQPSLSYFNLSERGSSGRIASRSCISSERRHAADPTACASEKTNYRDKNAPSVGFCGIWALFYFSSGAPPSCADAGLIIPVIPGSAELIPG